MDVMLLIPLSMTSDMMTRTEHRKKLRRRAIVFLLYFIFLCIVPCNNNNGNKGTTKEERWKRRVIIIDTMRWGLSWIGKENAMSVWVCERCAYTNPIESSRVSSTRQNCKGSQKQRQTERMVCFPFSFFLTLSHSPLSTRLFLYFRSFIFLPSPLSSISLFISLISFSFPLLAPSPFTHLNTHCNPPTLRNRRAHKQTSRPADQQTADQQTDR